jgi:undecaprenyl-diphosphatase
LLEADKMLAALSQWEGAFLLWVQEVVRQPWLDPVFSLYTKWGDNGLLWILLCALCLCFPKTRRAGAAGALALIGSLLVTNVLLKHLVGRIRPWLVLEGLLPLVQEGDPNSFPSGHSSAAFACAVAWWGTLPKRWMSVLALAAAALMALSRLYVGVHFPTDVACGVLVGSLCGLLGKRLERALEKGYRQR